MDLGLSTMQSNKGTPILLLGLLILQTLLLGIVAFRLTGLHRLLLDLQVGVSSVLVAVSVDGKNTDEILEIDHGYGPSKGSPNAPITIVEFSDFTCQACADLQPALYRILKQHGGDVRLVFRYFPLSFQGKPFLLAKAAECGHQQSAFWELHDLLFAHRREIESNEDLLEKVAGLGLDLVAFNDCLASEEVIARLRADFEAGRSYGVSSTPTLFVNGHRVLGAGDDNLKRAIAAHL